MRARHLRAACPRPGNTNVRYVSKFEHHCQHNSSRVHLWCGGGGDEGDEACDCVRLSLTGKTWGTSPTLTVAANMTTNKLTIDNESHGVASALGVALVASVAVSAAAVFAGSAAVFPGAAAAPVACVHSSMAFLIAQAVVTRLSTSCDPVCGDVLLDASHCSIAARS